MDVPSNTIFKEEKALSETTQNQNNRLEYVEGMSTVTAIYYDWPSRKTNEQHIQHKLGSPHRKISWKKHFRNLLKNTSSDVLSKLHSNA
jgi:hypothetical protein